MSRVQLLHWRESETAAYMEKLRAAGYQVEYDPQFEPAVMRRWRESPPDVFLIDLSRLPSQGREIAVALRGSVATRMVPLVFCEGDREKIDRVRKELPDAWYCTLRDLIPTLRKALRRPPADPVRPKQMMERYGGRSTAEKLGIRADSIVAVWNAPPDVHKIVGELPPGVAITEEDEPGAAVTLCFVDDPDELRQTVAKARARAARTRLWILWRKGQSARNGVNERHVREQALAVGLVDYKICSLNPVWSGMLFAQKRSVKPVVKFS